MRHHATILTSIWADEDFRKLSVDAQHLYLLLLSQPKTNLVGLLDYVPAKWANTSSDGKLKSVEAAATELEEARFVLIDRDTAEICVRTLVKHDTPRGWPCLRGMWACWAEIESPRISCAVLKDLPQEVLDNPQAPPPPGAYLLLNGLVDTPSDTPSDSRLDTRVDTRVDTQSHNPMESDTPSDTPSKMKKGDFDFWYSIYPRKIEKPHAVTAFTKARALDELDVIVAGTEAWIRCWQLSGTEKKFIPYPATFLNGQRWRDEPDLTPTAPPRREGRNLVQQTLLESIKDGDESQRDEGPDVSHVRPLAELAGAGGTGGSDPYPF